MKTVKAITFALLAVGLSHPAPGQTVAPKATAGRRVAANERAALVAQALPPVGVIRTIIGGAPLPVIEGSRALDSVLPGASGVAVDGAGNKYVASFLSQRVYKIDVAGAVTVFAGSGRAETSGDGGPATAAAIHGPSSVAVDGEAVYIVEQLGNRIRRVDEKGVITTVAGGGKRETAGKEKIPALEAHLDVPNGIAVKDGELFVTEFGGNRVRKISRAGVLTTIAGTGDVSSKGDGAGARDASLHGPTGIAVDSRGDIYVAEMLGGRVRRIDARGRISTLSGAGPRGQAFEGKEASAAKMQLPNGLALDSGANLLYVADFADNRVYTIDLRGNTIRTLAGAGQAPRVGEIGMARSGPARAVPIESPLGLALDPSGNLLITLYNQGAVLSVDSLGGRQAAGSQPIVRHVAGEFAAPQLAADSPQDTYLRNAGGVASNASGGVFVSDVFANRVLYVTADNLNASTFVGAEAAGTGMGNAVMEVHHPVGIVPVTNGVFIMEADSHRIRFVSEGAASIHFIDECHHPHGGDVYGAFAFAPTSSTSVNPAEAKTGAARAEPAPSTKEATPASLTASEPFMVYADTGNNRVRRVAQNGKVTTVAGNGQPVSSGDGQPAVTAGLQEPQDVVVGANGDLYISEGYRVRRVDQAGIITTVVGNGVKGFSGFGGLATKASITSAYGMALDGTDLYVADPWAGVVYKINAAGVITVFAGNGQRASTGDGGAPDKAALNAPIDLAIRRDPNGVVDLLIAELEGARVRAVRLR